MHKPGKSKSAADPLPESRQAPALSDEAIAKARELIGVWLRRDVHTQAIYEPVSLHDIRRWAQYSVGDDNPLWCDTEYAKRTMWGVNIAPPTFLYTIDTGIVAPGLPGIQWIFAGGQWEHYKPVKAGDTITASARLIRIEERKGRAAPRFVNQVGEVLFNNLAGELVSRYESQIFRIPRRRSGEQGLRYADQQEEKPKQESVTRYSRKEIEEIAAAYANEYRRGNDTLYWEDVKVGEELPVVLKGPLTLVDIVGFYSGRRTVYNVLKLAFLERQRHPNNVYYSPSTGVPMHPAAGHFDVEIAREIGMPGAYDQGWQRMNWAGHLITNWAGDRGFVTRIGGRINKPNLVGDLTRMQGTVIDKRREDGVAPVDLEWFGTNQRGEKNCNGAATVRLATREIGSST